MKAVMKRIGRMLLHAAVLLLIPLNSYLFLMDEVLTLVFAAAWLLLFELLFWKKEKKKWLMITLDVILLAFLFLACEVNPYWNTYGKRLDAFVPECDGERELTEKEALADFDFAMKYLNRIHPLAYGGLPQEVAAKAEQMRSGIVGRGSMKTYELSRAIENVYALLGDGHTHADESYKTYHYMKYNYYMRSQGYEPVGINGESYEELLSSHPGLVSYETMDYGKRMMRTRCSSLEGLRYLGVDITKEVTYNYLTEEGETYELTVTAEDFLPRDEYNAFSEEMTGEDLTHEEVKDFVYYTIDEDLSLALLTLDDCNYNAFYKKTVASMFHEVKEKGIQNVAVDVRNNSGGDSMVADEFIKYLDTEEYDSWDCEWRFHYFMLPLKGMPAKVKPREDTFSGNVYILTSVFSYSSAMDFAMLLQDNGLGKVIGEPCGNLPASYGQISGYYLPNSGVWIQISTKRWHRIDRTKEELPVIPDIGCRAEDALDVLKENL
ncbi:MAG: hypothetical protein K6E50_14610 [Lachnospiraceae bacterium]|nr:hypothetical protein [Lachnospiraceae bacterium]